MKAISNRKQRLGHLSYISNQPLKILLIVVVDWDLKKQLKVDVFSALITTEEGVGLGAAFKHAKNHYII